MATFGLAGGGGGGSTSPGGVNGDLQYNNSGNFGGLTPGTGVATALAIAANTTGGFATYPTTASILVNAQTGTTYTVLSTDLGKLVTTANASAIAVTLPQATGSFTTGWYTTIQNKGAGLATITPTTSTIAGNASIDLAPGMGVTVISDGTNYQVGGYVPGSQIRLPSGVFTSGNPAAIQFGAGGFITGISSSGNATMNFYSAGTEGLRLDNNGDTIVRPATATPASGSAAARLLFGTTAGFGIYYGSGSPSGALTAAQGSIYLRSDGSSVATRLYVNTNGSTTWTSFTSAA
jgi:hypothetical protein